MATANSPPSGQEPVGLSINLSSNNPFRNRATSPASPASPFDDPPPRPVSRNPFLDAPPPVRSPGTMSTQSDPKSLTAEDIFDSLTLDDKKPNQPPSSQRPQGIGSSDPKRPENSRPPQGSSRHRPTRSQEEALRARKPQGAPPPRPENSPQRRPPQRRPRRNSESSVMDFGTLTEEEKKMVEAKRRERRRAEAREAAARDGKAPERSSREGKARESKPRDGSENRKPRDRSHRPSRRMDIIDQLDATSIYGTGLFHHDGPFDALNPHRNRSGRRAPMQAFPKDSMNMSLGGSGPLNKTADHSTFMGNHDDEAFLDWSNGKKRHGSSTEVPIFDPIARGEIVHGDESVGLGTSTFLEGTPAARAAIAQQAQEEATQGLQRKKSLAQRMRPFKGSREYNHNRMRSPDGVQSAGLQTGGSGSSEANPFFSEYGKGEESISVRRDGALSPTSPPAPRRGSAGVALERRVTTDATPTPDEVVAAKPTGFIGRMKSLKGPRRPKHIEPQPADDPPSYPGTAV